MILGPTPSNLSVSCLKLTCAKVIKRLQKWDPSCRTPYRTVENFFGLYLHLVKKRSTSDDSSMFLMKQLDSFILLPMLCSSDSWLLLAAIIPRWALAKKNQAPKNVSATTVYITMSHQKNCNNCYQEGYTHTCMMKRLICLDLNYLNPKFGELAHSAEHQAQIRIGNSSCYYCRAQMHDCTFQPLSCVNASAL